jgi:hypothetical protein
MSEDRRHSIGEHAWNASKLHQSIGEQGTARLGPQSHDEYDHLFFAVRLASALTSPKPFKPFLPLQPLLL